MTVIATDVGGTVVLLNKIAEELTGWNRKDAIGLPKLQKGVSDRG